MPNCTETLTFISKPEFVSTTLHCLIFFELSIHSLGTYCILYKTPKSMESIKRTMLNFHFWSVVFDVFISALVTPYMVLPALAGYAFGFFSYLGVRVIYQAYLNFSVSFTVGASIIGLLECRYNLFMGGAKWQRYRLPYHAFNYLFSFTFVIPQLTWLLPDQPSAIQSFAHLLPCSISREVFGLHLSSEIGYLVVVVVIHNCHLSLIGVYFGFAVQFHFKKLRTLSKYTATLQHRLQTAMILQISIPVTMLLGPVSYAAFSVLTGYHNQEFTNLAIIFTGLHGIVSTSAMLLIYRPYRLAVINLLPGLDKYFETTEQSRTMVL